MKRSAQDEVTITDAHDDEEVVNVASVSKKSKRSCPYLDTVDRSVLDFDFEKICSVSFLPVNVYACLVCGKYFQGRGKGSHAYTHSLQVEHHVFINLQNKKAYCLPDDYEIEDSSLDDVKKYLDPQLPKETIASLDKNVVLNRTLDGKQYICGVVGLNNINAHDHINTVLQALAHLPAFRDFWLNPSNYLSASGKAPTELVGRFGVLMRRLWNQNNYRNHISPHELLQEISLRSEKKFRIGLTADPLDFLSWLLNTLQKDLAAGADAPATPAALKKINNTPTVITKTFQGRVKVTTEKELPKKKKEKVRRKRDFDVDTGSKEAESSDEEVMPEEPAEKVVTVAESPFYFLSLDVPSMPLFKDEHERNILPQQPLFNLLNKFDGSTTTFLPSTKENKKYILTSLPKYLVLHMKRFTKTMFGQDKINTSITKNRTIINFPVKGLDLQEYVQLPPGTKTSTRYDLLANIRHDGGHTDGTYSLHFLHKSNGKWYDVQDLIIEEKLSGDVAVSEAYIQIYERQD